MLPAGGAFVFVFQTVGRQLLQQQATGATTIGAELDAGANLLGHDEVVGEAVGQRFAIQIDDALVALAPFRVDGQRQRAIRHQVSQGSVGGNPVRLVTGQATDLALAGALDHQQRDRAFGACLQNQQAIELQRADQQRCGRHQLAEQLRDRLRVGVFGQDFGVAELQRDQFATGVAVIEDEALGEVVIRVIGHRSGYLN
ncbi:hypothetical protein D3C86_993430 [compost metagenome]